MRDIIIAFIGMSGLMLLAFILGATRPVITCAIPADRYECTAYDVRDGVCTEYSLKEGGK